VTPDILLHREAYAALLATLRKIAARDKTISVRPSAKSWALAAIIQCRFWNSWMRARSREGDVRVLLET
jgi:hypothetical protein